MPQVKWITFNMRCTEGYSRYWRINKKWYQFSHPLEASFLNWAGKPKSWTNLEMIKKSTWWWERRDFFKLWIFLYKKIYFKALQNLFIWYILIKYNYFLGQRKSEAFISINNFIYPNFIKSLYSGYPLLYCKSE